MKSKKLKRLSFINLLASYFLLFLFFFFILFKRPPETAAIKPPPEPPVASLEIEEVDLFNDEHSGGNIYIERDRSVGIDHSQGVISDRAPDVVVERPRIGVIDNWDSVELRDDQIVGGYTSSIQGETNNENFAEISRDAHRSSHVDGVLSRDGNRVHVGRSGIRSDDIGVVDLAGLSSAIEEARQEERAAKEKIGMELEDPSSLTLAKEGGVDFTQEDFDPLGPEGDGNGFDKGDLYAYNFPSQGVGAGVGNPAIGAGAGSAGIGAGIGEAVLNGKPVPALGGVGTSLGSSTSSPKGPALALPMQGGVGGLVSGAGAGGAAGLTTALAKERLGLGVDKGRGLGGGGGARWGSDAYNVDHLPPNGALHIMMHVDGSGSILNTRKTLEIMKDSLLKSALLPYYNNDESLYHQRVSIVDNNGERTLKFFGEAASKENVLALVFQDEAQPSYHLPNFNKQPETHYLEDLNALKSSLNNKAGLYRGIMFQVDRGRTFAKSFKEFVENSFQGKDYLEKNNLKKYYWKNNPHHIKNKDGIVFSDMYHTKDDGSPQYYMELIFEAAKKVGLDLNIHGAGLTDGTYNHSQ